jgi:hypothetical protein
MGRESHLRYGRGASVREERSGDGRSRFDDMIMFGEGVSIPSAQWPEGVNLVRRALLGSQATNNISRRRPWRWKKG